MFCLQQVSLVPALLRQTLGTNTIFFFLKYPKIHEAVWFVDAGVVCRCWCRIGCAGGGGIFSWCLVPCNSLVIVFVIVVTLAAKRANPAFYPNCLLTCNLFIRNWSSQKLYLRWQLFMNMYRQFFRLGWWSGIVRQTDGANPKEVVTWKHEKK